MLGDNRAKPRNREQTPDPKVEARRDASGSVVAKRGEREERKDTDEWETRSG